MLATDYAAPRIYTKIGTSSEHHRSIATTNPIEHLNREIRRRTRSIGVFPSVESALRLITMNSREQA